MKVTFFAAEFYKGKTINWKDEDEGGSGDLLRTTCMTEKVINFLTKK